jgi:hypothetical protein
MAAMAAMAVMAAMMFSSFEGIWTRGGGATRGTDTTRCGRTG